MGGKSYEENDIKLLQEAIPLTTLLNIVFNLMDRRHELPVALPMLKGSHLQSWGKMTGRSRHQDRSCNDNLDHLTQLLSSYKWEKPSSRKRKEKFLVCLTKRSWIQVWLDPGDQQTLQTNINS